MNIRDAYKELGVSPGASKDECKGAYRRLISEWHPDRNSSVAAQNKSQLINRAWHVLENAGFPASDSSTRDWYEADMGMAAAARAAAEAAASSYSDYQYYGYTGGKKGKNIKRTAKVTLEEANNGFIYEFEAKTKDACSVCFGEKCSDELINCMQCNGRGYTGKSYYSSYCFFCDGNGRLLKPCGACNGTGHGNVRTLKNSIRIRGGMRTGDTMIARGLAGRSPDGEGDNGDLTIEISIKEHPIFYFEGEDKDGNLAIDIPISVIDFMCGGEIDVPTLYGTKKLTLNSEKSRYTIKDVGYSGLKGQEALSVNLKFQFDALEDNLKDILSGAREYMRQKGMKDGPDVTSWKKAVEKWKNPNEAGKKTARKKSTSK